MATEDIAGEAAEKGMPQLNFDTWPNQIFWLLVALVIIWLVLTRIAIPRIAAILAERKGMIGNDLAAAEELKGKAKAAEAAYDQALETARAEAAKIVAATKAEIQKDVAAAIAKAEVQIAADAPMLFLTFPATLQASVKALDWVQYPDGAFRFQFAKLS